jgi:hypothetical protein|tara:strand:- start:900 stop:1142 length:243 start_codon:yes stop_codon:yes gene_type:complete
MWVICVVCPETGQAEGLLSPCLNMKMIHIFLEQFSKTIPVDEYAVVIWDSAGFHWSKVLMIPENITLVCLFSLQPRIESH